MSVRIWILVFSVSHTALCPAIMYDFICLDMHRNQLGTLSNTSYLWHAFLTFSLKTKTDSSLFRAPPPSAVFHFAMECFMCGAKTSSRVEQCGTAAPWLAPSPNLILALLKIVCIPSQTDRPLFPESLCFSRHWKRPLCASSTAPSSHEKFTGWHLVWDGEKEEPGKQQDCHQ